MEKHTTPPCLRYSLTYTTVLIRHGGGTIARGECTTQCVVSFLSACTPIWLLKTVNPKVVEGGFTSRCLFVVSNEPKQLIPWPDGDDTEDDRSWMLHDLQRIREQAANSDAITLTDGGMTAYRKWYNERKRSYDSFKQSFEAREDAHVLRVAALMCINDGTWRIDHHHVAKAVQLIAEVKDSGALIFEGGEMRTKYAISLDAVRSSLISAGMDPIPKHQLTRKCRRGLEMNDFNALLEVLHEIGAVQRFMDVHQDRGKPTEYYRGTNLLMGRGLGEQVLDRFM